MSSDQTGPAITPSSARRAIEDARGDIARTAEALRRAIKDTRNARLRGEFNALLWQAERALGLYPGCFSQSGQDAWLDRTVFKQKRGGVFVEIGGYDGVTGSNCLFFEAMRGWSGLLIEPSPSCFAEASTIRRVPCLDIAVAAHAGHASFFEVRRGYRQMGGLTATYDPATRKQVETDNRFDGAEITVETRPLADILREHGLQRIDYISLDVEGGEQAILDGFPFAEFDIHAWTIENNAGDPAIAACMRANGYQLVEAIGVDEVYVRAR